MNDLFDLLGIPVDDTRCQWSVGDECFCRIDGKGDPVLAYVMNIDIPTRRLKLAYSNWILSWQYMEHCWKESK